MRRLLLPILLLAAGPVARAAAESPTPPAEGSITILVSIDGFRWDYLELHDAPNLRRLAASGVRAKRMTPCFPSKTFPNHYSIVTGLRPENHGIIANWFFDTGLGEMFGMAKKETHWWKDGIPIWITAARAGIRSGCFFWPGSETEHGGVRPAYFKPFDKNLPNESRVDGLLGWLALPEGERPGFCTLYFENVDVIGHIHGAEAPETAAAVADADAAIGRLLRGLEKINLRERTNLVIVSDHGMSPCGPDKVIFFEDLMDVSQVQIESNGPNGGVRPKPGTVSPEELAESIRRRAPPQLKVYLRHEMPERFHYRASDRIPPVMLVCDDHWNIESRTGWIKRAASYSLASHGWDPATPNMGALFLAHGPAFREGAVIDDFENIHVYELLCRLVGIRPEPNDGDDRLAALTLRD